MFYSTLPLATFGRDLQMAVKPLRYFLFGSYKIHPFEKNYCCVLYFVREHLTVLTPIPFPHPTLQRQTTQVLESCKGSSASMLYKDTVTAMQLLGLFM